jgi:hypothetical protein
LAKNKVIDPILAPVLRVPHGLKDLLQADLQRKQGQKISVGKMLQKPSVILPTLSREKALQTERGKIPLFAL